MAWNIGDEGFEMVLGNYVPHIIDDHIIGALEPLLSRDGSLQGLPYREHPALGHPPGRPRASWTRSSPGWSSATSSWSRPARPCGTSAT